MRNNDSVTTYSEASFTFKGTGFDLISRTGHRQGTIRVTVYDTKGSVERALTVDNKGELELYQIPVVSIEDLPYGKHRVVIGVNRAMTLTGALAPLSRGGEGHLQGRCAETVCGLYHLRQCSGQRPCVEREFQYLHVLPNGHHRQQLCTGCPWLLSLPFRSGETSPVCDLQASPKTKFYRADRRVGRGQGSLV